MAKARGSITVGLAVILVLSAQPAVAQSTSASWPVLSGQKVRITGVDGQVIAGKIVTATPEVLEVGGDRGTVKVEATAVRKIQVSDPVTNGAVTGAVVLGLVGMLFGAAADATGDVFAFGVSQLLGGAEVHRSGGSGALVGGFVGVGLGAVIGAGLDAMKLKTVYEVDARITVDMRPIVSNAGKGLGITVRW